MRRRVPRFRPKGEAYATAPTARELLAMQQHPDDSDFDAQRAAAAAADNELLQQSQALDAGSDDALAAAGWTGHLHGGQGNCEDWDDEECDELWEEEEEDQEQQPLLPSKLASSPGSSKQAKGQGQAKLASQAAGHSARYAGARGVVYGQDGTWAGGVVCMGRARGQGRSPLHGLSDIMKLKATHFVQ